MMNRTKMLNDRSLGSLQFDDFNPLANPFSARSGFDSPLSDLRAEANTISPDGLAHDINNLLLVIQNTMELAWPAPKSKTDREALDTMGLAISKARGLALDIMEASTSCRIANRTPTSPAELITAFKPLLRGIAAKNVTLNFRLQKEAPNVKIDRDQFCEILINLVKNASEAFAGRPGEVTISTFAENFAQESSPDYSSCGCHPKSGRGTVFSVGDNGPGVPSDLLDIVLDKTFTTKRSGHGLGLANVVELVKLNHGGISIKTSPGNGFVFNLWVPETQEKAQPFTPTPDDDTGEGSVHRLNTVSGGKRPCVLMLDDDPAILQSSALLLSSMQTDAIMVDNTYEALKMFNERRGEIDVIFLDANVDSSSTMPLLESFRRLDPDVPCVIISGYAESKIRGLFNPDLYNGYLGKPFTRSDIRNMLARFSKKPPPDLIRRHHMLSFGFSCRLSEPIPELRRLLI